MTRGDRERLTDIAEAITRIKRYLVDAGEDTDLQRDAILHNLLTIGEAVKGLGEDTRGSRADIPWRQIAGLRDVIAHEYFRIDIVEIRKIVSRDLAPLSAAVNDLLHQEDSR